MTEHTIKTKNSRKLYVPYYVLFVVLFFTTLVMSIQGTLALSAFTASIVLIFFGVNATEVHRVWQSYEVNPRAVVHTKGLITRHSKRIDLFAINTVTVHQNLYHRIFNMGDIHIHVANASHQTVLKNLHAPKIFAETIQNNMHQARNKQPFEEDDSNSQQLFKHSKDNDFFDQPDEESNGENDAEIFKRLQEI